MISAVRNITGTAARPTTTSYWAQLVHPDCREVFPLAPEPMLKQDGARKNDCERNAAKRLLKDIRREHPHLKLVVVAAGAPEDGLASNAPHIRLLKELNYRFILGAKPKDHTFLFDWVGTVPSTQYFEITDEKKVHHRFRYLSNVPLNDSHFDLEVNFLEYRETRLNGKTTHFARVTDFPIDATNLMLLMRGARTRWKIENETYNTLKNQGYHFEHNFGHGYKNLSTVMVHLMMLAFLTDQIQQRCCRLFQRAMASAGSRSRFWGKVCGLFQHYLIPDWEALYLGIADGLRPTPIPFNTS